MLVLSSFDFIITTSTGDSGRVSLERELERSHLLHPFESLFEVIRFERQVALDHRPIRRWADNLRQLHSNKMPPIGSLRTVMCSSK